MSKKGKIVLISIIILILLFGIFIYIKSINKEGNIKIIATKTIQQENELSKDIKYTIRIKNYKIVDIEKEIIFSSKEQAEQEFNRYQIINKSENKNLGVKVKNKKLILTMTEKQFIEDVQYKQEGNVTISAATGERKQVIEQNELVNFLKKEGYNVK